MEVPVLLVDDSALESEFDSSVVYGADVLADGIETPLLGDLVVGEEVVSVLVEEIDRDLEASLEEAQVETGVELARALPAEVIDGDSLSRHSGDAIVDAAHSIAELGVEIADSLVSCETVAEAKFSVGEFYSLHRAAQETLVGETPCCGN